MIQASEKSDCVFFGEFHDNPIAHWLQLELVLKQNASNTALAFEMFESDQQNVLNAYLSGALTEKQFKDSCRLWPNYNTDYKPLVEYAKTKGMPCIASNVKRHYASILFKQGRKSLDTLSENIRLQFAPLDYPVDTALSQNKAILEMGGHAMGMNLVDAQAFKDATMAMHISRILSEGKKVIHFNGAFHSDFFQGILWYLDQNKALEQKKMLTISTVSQSDIRKLDREHLGRADFILCIPENMTKTH